jgi:hypothetical protein
MNDECLNNVVTEYWRFLNMSLQSALTDVTMGRDSTACYSLERSKKNEIVDADWSH